MKALHTIATIIKQPWNVEVINPSIASATISHTVSFSQVSVLGIELHPFNCVNIPNAAVATWINQTHTLLSCNPVGMAHPSQLIVIVLISSRPAMKRPINLPRNLRLSELNLFVLRSPGFSFVLILWIVKIPALNKFCKKTARSEHVSTFQFQLVGWVP